MGDYDETGRGMPSRTHKHLNCRSYIQNTPLYNAQLCAAPLLEELSSGKLASVSVENRIGE